LAASSLSFSPDPAPPYLYTLSLHDALPIFLNGRVDGGGAAQFDVGNHILVQGLVAVALYLLYRHRPFELAVEGDHPDSVARSQRSDEHTSELQSRGHLVCRLLLEKKKKHTE